MFLSAFRLHVVVVYGPRPPKPLPLLLREHAPCQRASPREPRVRTFWRPRPTCVKKAPAHPGNTCAKTLRGKRWKKGFPFVSRHNKFPHTFPHTFSHTFSPHMCGRLPPRLATPQYLVCTTPEPLLAFRGCTTGAHGQAHGSQCVSPGPPRKRPGQTTKTLQTSLPGAYGRECMTAYHGMLGITKYNSMTC